MGAGPLSGDEIIFERDPVSRARAAASARPRHALRLPRPTRCPAQATCPSSSICRAADAIERHALSRHVRRAGGNLAGQGMRRRRHRHTVRLDHTIARGQALRQHPGELHLHPRFMGRDHPRARPAVPRSGHRRLVPHASQLRDFSFASRPVHSSAFLRSAACRWPTSSTRSSRPEASSSGATEAGAGGGILPHCRPCWQDRAGASWPTTWKTFPALQDKEGRSCLLASRRSSQDAQSIFLPTVRQSPG